MKRLFHVNDMEPDVLLYTYDLLRQFDRECYFSENEYKSQHRNFIGSGGQGVVYAYKKYAIKLFYDESQHDPYILQELQDLNTYPKLYYHNDNAMITEFVIGGSLKHMHRRMEFNSKWEAQLEDDLNETVRRGFYLSDIHRGNMILNNASGFIKIVDVGEFYNSMFHEDVDKIIEPLKNEIDFVLKQNKYAVAI